MGMKGGPSECRYPDRDHFPGSRLGISDLTLGATWERVLYDKAHAMDLGGPACGIAADAGLQWRPLVKVPQGGDVVQDSGQLLDPVIPIGQV